MANATDIIRQTAKWLVTLGAGLGSVLLAGIRFGDLGRTDIGSPMFWTAVSGVVLALGSVGTIVGFASRVLLGRYSSLIGVLQTAEEVEVARPDLPAELTDPMIRAMTQHKDFLLRGAANSTRDLFRHLRLVNDRLAERAESLTPTEKQELLLRQADLEAAAERVIDFADHWVTKQRFRHLLWSLAVAGSFATIGVALFALALSNVQSQVEVQTRPIAVRVFLSPAGQEWARRKLGCAVSALDAVAIGGSLEAPEVVAPQVGSCSGTRFTVNESIGVAVPKQ